MVSARIKDIDLRFLTNVLMYYNAVMLCYGISADELKQAYTEKYNAVVISRLYR